MSKHFHLYIHRARSAGKTADAGEFDEGKHKRDAGGKFATSSGDSTHHLSQSMHHSSQAASKGKGHPDYASHAAAAQYHYAASHALGFAQLTSKDPHMQGTSQSSMKEAQQHADKAKEHEAKISSTARPNSSGTESGGAGASATAAHTKLGTPITPDQFEELKGKYKHMHTYSSPDGHKAASGFGAPSEADSRFNVTQHYNAGQPGDSVYQVFERATKKRFHYAKQPASAGVKPAAAAAPKGFQVGKQGHLEAKAANQYSSNENLGNAKRHLEQQGFTKTHAEGHDLGSGPHAEFQQHIEYAHKDGRTMQIVHATRGRGGSAGGWTQIQDLSKKG